MRLLDVASTIYGRSTRTSVVFNYLKVEVIMLEIQSLFYEEMQSRPILNEKKVSLDRPPEHDPTTTLPLDKNNIREMIAEIEHITSVFDQKLRFEYDENLQRIIVKVIDKDTDRIIKQLPPEELQKVYLRIRQAIGILIDKII